MTNSGDSEPRRGPRRFGPSASGSSARRREPFGFDQPDDSTTIYSGDGGYSDDGSGRRGARGNYRSVPPAAREPYAAAAGSSAAGPGQPPSAGAHPPAGQYPGGPARSEPQAAWSQVNPPTAVFPAAQSGPAAPPPYRAGPPPGGRPPGPPPGGTGPDEPRRRQTPRWVLASRITALVLAVVVLAGAGVAYAFQSTLQSNSGISDAAANAGSGGVTFEGGMTILLVGSDARTDADGNVLSPEELAQVGTEDDGGGINTDTLMILHIPEGGGKATAVSLPRDTWIGPKVMSNIVGPYADGSEGPYNANKINSFYSTAKAYTEERLVSEGVSDKAQIERESNEAGRTMLIRVVQSFTGMKIDHYAEVNLLGFYLLSNAIGGVPVCLNAAVDDPWSGANFPAGPQEVQGTAALAFVRQRHGLPEGDLDRVRRQQAFLSGAASKILSVGTLTNPSKLNDLVGAVDRSVIFDKDFSVLTFAEQITNLSSGNIDFQTLPTRGPESSTDADALATDPKEIKAFFQAIDGGSGSGAQETQAPVDPASITVDVQDGTIADGVTDFAAKTVTKGGFKLGTLGVVAGTKSGNEQQTTEVHYPAGARGAAQQVSNAFGVGELVEDDAVKSGHVLVMVGTDLDVPNGLRGPAAALSAPAAAVPAAPAAQFAASSAVPCVN